MNHHESRTETARFWFECSTPGCIETSKKKKSLTKAADHAKARGWLIEGNGTPPLCPIHSDEDPDSPEIRAEMHSRQNNEPHLFERETSNYVATLSAVDRMDAHEARRNLKWILDAMLGVGDGTPDDPRAIDFEKDWSDLPQIIWDHLADLRPEAADVACDECGAHEAHAPDCDQRPGCNECEQREGHRAGCPNAPCPMCGAVDPCKCMDPKK